MNAPIVENIYWNLEAYDRSNDLRIKASRLMSALTFLQALIARDFPKDQKIKLVIESISYVYNEGSYKLTYAYNGIQEVDKARLLEIISDIKKILLSTIDIMNKKMNENIQLYQVADTGEFLNPFFEWVKSSIIKILVAGGYDKILLVKLGGYEEGRGQLPHLGQ